MADVYGHIGMKINDSSYEVTSMPLYFKVPDTTTVATLASDAATIAGLIQNVCDGQMTKIVVVLEVAPTTTHSPNANSRIESTGLFKAACSDGFVRHFGIDIPAILPATVVTGGKQINFANAGIAALVAALDGGQGSLDFVSPSGSLLTEVLEGRQTFRKHRRVANRA